MLRQHQVQNFATFNWLGSSGVPRRGGFNNPPEIPKALQNRAKLNPTVKTVKIAEFMTPTPQDVRKKGSKILNYLGSQLFYFSNNK